MSKLRKGPAGQLPPHLSARPRTRYSSLSFPSACLWGDKQSLDWQTMAKWGPQPSVDAGEGKST